MQGFEKISTNCDILIHLFQMLNFEDQLRLARVSNQLKSVFQMYLWKESYRSLTIYENRGDYVVTNETGSNRLCLTQPGLQEFLGIYAGEVQHLTLTRFVLADIGQFKHITSLKYYCDKNPLEYLQLVARNLPMLECLELHCRFRSDRDELITIGENLSVETLLQMKYLKRLCIENGSNNTRLEYQHFCEIVSNLKLEYLKLDSVVQADDNVWLNDNHPVYLKELYIETAMNPCKWSNNYLQFLRSFEKLVTLNIAIVDAVNSDDILFRIADVCKHLERLAIRDTRFWNIQYFATPPKITELSLCACRGLSADNLKQLLTETRITKFSSRHTYYEGLLDDFRISPLIQVLEIGRLHKRNDLLRHSYGRGWPVGSDTVSGLPLATCTGLKTLDMCDSQISLDTLLQLHSLQKLSLEYVDWRFQWSYIIALLSHPPLRELTIKTFDCKSCSDLLRPTEGFPTGVRCVQVPFSLFEAALDFWLDLFCRNTKMKIMCRAFYPCQMKFLRKLMDHERFPRSLKSIDVFGYVLNCQDLRRNFSIAMKKLDHDTGHLVFDERRDSYCLTICRK